MSFPHSSHLRAQVQRVQVHRDTMRLQDAHQLIGDLDPDPLLDGEAPGEDSHEPGQLGDADDLLVSDVADVCVPVERERVMLAEREEFDGAFDRLRNAAVRAAAAFGRKGREQLGVALIPIGCVKERTYETRWRGPGARRVEVHPEGGEYLGGVTLELFPLLGGDRARTSLLPLRGLFRIEDEARHRGLLAQVCGWAKTIRRSRAARFPETVRGQHRSRWATARLSARE